MLAAVLVLAPLLLFGLWQTALARAPAAPAALLHNRRIVLLIAHPDDESMFFAPTVQALTAAHLHNHVKILCLSTGNADGLGSVRRGELERAAVTLGLRRAADVFVVDDEARFRDGMGERWAAADVAGVLASAFAPTAGKEAEGGDGKATGGNGRPGATIDVLITFDGGGVSGHPNHVALYHGARHFVAGLGPSAPVSLYTLTSVGLVRKYSSIVDAVATLVTAKPGADAVFVSDLGQYTTARRAMVAGHRSQMVWFRWGWIALGRYMVVNDLRRERVP